MKISIKTARDVDGSNAKNVVVVDEIGDKHTLTVFTNPSGQGLWVNGRQVLGTGQFTYSDASLRRYLEKRYG